MGAETMKRFTCDSCGATSETDEHVYSPKNWVNMRLQTYGFIVFHKDVWVCSRACLIASLNRIASELEKPKRRKRKAKKKKKKTARRGRQQ